MTDSIRHDMLPDPAARLADIQRRLIAACAQAGNDADQVTITAVSKKHTAQTVQRALVAGHRCFGENRVQEALGKWPALKADYPDVELRLIGPLQSNKAADAVAFFDVIETVDRPKIARVLAEECRRQGRAPKFLVQVNTGEEAQKAGVAPQDADAFLSQCANDYGLKIAGLMCIPPHDAPPAPHFALLAKIAERHALPELSMGMSADFEIAAQLGATHVRIGTEIFGARPE
ncbi:MAG: YggS family pyridoxal phosphate-dependent enzyme [Pseudomonadota bacterium]